MKTSKSRTKKQTNVHVIYDIETNGKEFLNHWSHKSDENIYKWQNLLMQFLASLSEKKRQEFIK